MTNKNISGLTAATTPLAGTELVPVWDGAGTKKVTVANLTVGRDVSMAGLTATGNATIGDATTDTVTVNGYMGVGGVGITSSGLCIQSTELLGTSAFGIYSNPRSTTLNTTSLQSYYSVPRTVASAHTVADVAGYRAADATKGAGSAITNQHGLRILDQTQGTNNYGVTSAVSSSANKWNIYASGTAQNAFAGNVRIGSVVAPTVALDVTGAVKVSTTITPLDNIIQGTAAKGINFTANTPAAGMTSQLLNWYEEGTWTPNQGAGLTVVGAFSSSGTYTRVGRQVTVRGQVVGATSVAVSAAGVISSNLPFTAAVTHAGSMFNSAVNASGVVQITSASVVAATTIAATPNITFTATYTV